MSFSVIPTDKFKKEAKRLARKHPSLKEELAELNDTLTNNPETGTRLVTAPTKSGFLSKAKEKEKAVAGGSSLMW